MNMGKKNVYIGLDIGSSSIKAVEIEIGGGQAILRKANVVPARDGIKKAVTGMAIKNAKVIGIVDCPTSCLRYFTVPVMPNRELAEAIKWEAKDNLPLPLDEVLMDYEVQEEVMEAGARKFKVKLAAAPIKLVENTLQRMSDAGIEPVSLIEPPLAAEFLAAGLKSGSRETFAIIDIGAEFTGINILKNNSIKFHRKLNYGGGAITKAMTAGLVSEQGRVELNLEQAERIKIKYGIPGEPSADLIEGKITTTQLISLIRPETERLLQEIERSFEYYREGSGGDKVKSAVLLGGGARLPGLAGFLQDSLGVPVAVGDPLKDINVAAGAFDKESVAPCELAEALGAAISEGKGINLLPRELKQKPIRTFEYAAIRSVAFAVVTALILVYIGMRIQLDTYNDKIRYGNEIKNNMAPSVEIAANYGRLKGEISAKKKLIDSILTGTQPWDEVFKELSNKVTKDVVFTEMRLDNGELFIKGEIIENAKNREEALADLIAALGGGMFSNVSLLSARMGEEGRPTSEFEIKCVF